MKFHELNFQESQSFYEVCENIVSLITALHDIVVQACWRKKLHTQTIHFKIYFKSSGEVAFELLNIILITY